MDLPPELRDLLIREAYVLRSLEKLVFGQKAVQANIDDLKQKRTGVGFLLAASTKGRADKQQLQQSTSTAFLIRNAVQRTEAIRAALAQRIQPRLEALLAHASPEYAKARAALDILPEIGPNLDRYEQRAREFLRAVSLARAMVCAGYQHDTKRFSERALQELHALQLHGLKLEEEGRQCARLRENYRARLRDTVFEELAFAEFEVIPWGFWVESMHSMGVVEAQQNFQEILTRLESTLGPEIARWRDEARRLSHDLAVRVADYVRTYWKMLSDYTLAYWVDESQAAARVAEIEGWYNSLEPQPAATAH